MFRLRLACLVDRPPTKVCPPSLLRHGPQGSPHRIISLILYLNEPDWQPADGGHLRIYVPDPVGEAQQSATGGEEQQEPHIDVTPLGGEGC